jgi:hypothetical protein
METARRIPQARDTGLVVEELGDELLVYDLQRDEAHSLGAAASRVWKACDGTTTVDSLSVQLDLDREIVADAISGLRECHLLDEVPTAGITRRGFSLRAVKIGAAAAAVPLIVSIAAPAAAMAVTESFCAGIAVSANGCGDCHKYGCCCCEPPGGTTKPCHADCITSPDCNIGTQPNCNGSTANCKLKHG